MTTLRTSIDKSLREADLVIGRIGNKAMHPGVSHLPVREVALPPGTSHLLYPLHRVEH